MDEDFLDNPFTKAGEGGCSQGTAPVFVDGSYYGCASFSTFSNYYNPDDNITKGPVIRINSFEDIYGALPEGAVNWEVGDLDEDGLNEVYAVDENGDPHTVFGGVLENVTQTPYDDWLEQYGQTDGTTDTEETEESVIQEYYEVFGEELVNDVINKTGDLIETAKASTEDPLGAIKNILDNVLPAAKDCPSWTDPCTSASGGGTVAGGGNPCWKDCVEVGLIFGIPGLPMPPGFMGKTVRDLDNAVKAIGKDIEDFLEDPSGIFDEIGKAVEAVGKTIDDFIEDPFGTLEGIIDDIKDQIKDIFAPGADPQGIYDWMKGILGNVVSGVVWNTIGDTIDELFVGGDDDDSQTTIDCTKLDEFNANKDYCLDQGFVNCDELTSQTGKQLTGGIKQGQENCEEIQDPQCIRDGIWNGEKCVCPDGSDKADEDEPLDGDCSDGDAKTPQEICEDKGLTYDPNNENADEDGCVDTGDDGGDGSTDTTDINCDEPVSPNPSLTYGDRLNAYKAACADYCDDGSGTKPEDHVNNSCYMSLIADCEDVDENSTEREKAFCGYQRCGEDTEKKGQLVKDVTTDCNGSTTDPVKECTDPNATGSDENGNCICEKGFYPSRDGTKCIPDGGPEGLDCTDPNITDQEKIKCNWVQCPNDSSLHPPGSDPEKVCADVVPPECEDPQTDQEYKDCGYVQCGYGTVNGGQWFPPNTDMEEACGGQKECTNGATNYPECNICPRGQQLINSQCEQTIEECTNGAIDPPNCQQCPSGQEMINGQCAETVCDNGATIESGCQECPSGQDFDADGNCGPIYECNDPNATVQQGGLTPGACGPCKEGYVFDGAVERCVQESVDPCDDPAYAAANPTECGTPPPECNDCTCDEYAAANPDECGPTLPPPEPPSGGTVVGGGMFSFDATPFNMQSDPQLLARVDFPIVDFLSESLAKQTKNDLMSGMLTGKIV